jgi:hypothetical protein
MANVMGKIGREYSRFEVEMRVVGGKWGKTVLKILVVDGAANLVGKREGAS